MLYIRDLKCNVDSVKDKLIIGLVILIMIVGSGDSLNVGLRLSVRWGLIGLNFIITGILCLKKGTINITMVKVYAILCVTVLISMVVNMDFHGYTMWIILAIALLVEETIEYDKFYEIFEIIMLMVCVFSLFGMGIAFIRPDIIQAFPKIDGAVTEIHNLLLTVVPVESTAITRNYGIFREPAMFCIYIGLALIRQFFFVKQPSFFKCTVFLGTIITTKSVTGYIAVLFLVTVYVLTKRKSWREYGFLAFVLIEFVLIERRLELVNYFVERLDTQGASAYSVNSRLYSIVGGLMAGLTNPIAGRGAAKSNLVFEECVKLINPVAGACWANMTTYLFASFGIIFIFFFLLGLSGIGVPYSNSKVIRWSGLCFVLLLLCGETMTYSTIMYTYMMYGLKNLRDCKRFNLA